MSSITITKEATMPLQLTELRKLIPKEYYEPPTVKNIVYFIIKASFFLIPLYGACLSDNFFISTLLTLISGVFLFSLGTVGHDCGHGLHVKPKWLNEAIGQFSMTFHGLPYAGWKHSHNTHHASTNEEDKDPDRLWLYTDEYLAFNKVERYLWRLFHTRLFWMSAVGHYFRSMLPWSFKIAEKTKSAEVIKDARIDLVYFFSILIAFHGGMYALGFGFKSVIIHFFTILIALMCLSAYVRTEHYLLTNGSNVKDKPWLTSRTVLQNSFLDFLATNLNYHVEHHILQVIPHDNLPKIRPLMKTVILDAKQPYHEDYFLKFMVKAFNEEFFVLERNTFRPIPLSELKAKQLV